MIVEVYDRLAVGDAAGLLEADGRWWRLALIDLGGRIPEAEACIPLVDGPGNPPLTLLRALDAAFHEWRRGGAVLICCAVGRSRSVTIATATLALASGLNWPDAFERVLSRHPEAAPHPDLVELAVRAIAYLRG